MNLHQLNFTIKEDKIYLVREMPIDNAVLVENQKLIKAEIKCQINDKENRVAEDLFIESSFKEGTIYTISGYKVEIKSEKVFDGLWSTELIDVAVISPIEPENKL